MSYILLHWKDIAFLTEFFFNIHFFVMSYSYGSIRNKIYYYYLNFGLCVAQRRHLWKNHVIFFFGKFILILFSFGGVLRKELLYKRSTQHCIKQNRPRQFSILINDSDLRKIDFHKTSKRTTLIEQALLVRRTPCLIFKQWRI